MLTPSRRSDGGSPSERHRPVRARRWARRCAITVGAASILFATAAAAASMPRGGTKGDPQPELARFKVGATGDSGTGAVLPDGTLVLASPSESETTINVCMMHPGDRKCAATAVLRAHANDEFSAPPVVLATGGKNVSVVVNDCCYIGDNGVLVFNSSNDGKTFGGYVQAGNAYSVGDATFTGGNIVEVDIDPHSGTQVQEFVPHPSSPSSEIAVVSSLGDEDASIGTYKGGVLVASDDLTNTYVEYAQAGSDFGDKSSYTKVATISHEDTIAISGNALLTDVRGSISGNVRIRFFNGTSFGAAYKVPQPKYYDDGYFALQETGATAHVFYLDRRAGYDVFEASTTNGTHWSGPTEYQTGIQSGDLAPVLGRSGAGRLRDGRDAAHGPAHPERSVRHGLSGQVDGEAGHEHDVEGQGGARAEGPNRHVAATLGRPLVQRVDHKGVLDGDVLLQYSR